MGAPAKLVVSCWVVFFVFWFVSAFSVKRAKLKQPLIHRLLYLVIALVAVLTLKGSVLAIPWNRAVLPRTIGMSIFAASLVLLGLVIAIWARVTLGGNWSARVTLKENHELIQRGPYRIVRHPIYSGLLVMILGTAILAGQASGFFALFICFLGFWIKSRQEEKLLTRHLPGYEEYKAHTKALIPFLL